MRLPAASMVMMMIGPDIVLNDKGKETCLLINRAILNDSNINIKETAKISKHTDLEIKVSRMWKFRTKMCHLNWNIRNN